jgi:hypothetical protein
MLLKMLNGIPGFRPAYIAPSDFKNRERMRFATSGSKRTAAPAAVRAQDKQIDRHL